jgi:hypothetical protein
LVPPPFKPELGAGANNMPPEAKPAGPVVSEYIPPVARPEPAVTGWAAFFKWLLGK